MTVRSFLAVLLTIGSIGQAASQEQLGLKLGNYGGVHSLQLNPSWQVHGPLKWDVNILSAAVFTEQDYLFGARGSMLRVLNRGVEWITDPPSSGSDAGTDPDAVPVYFNNRSHYNAQFQAVAMAPSFMVNLREHSFGLYFTGRTWASGHRLDGSLNYYNLTDTAQFIGTFDPMQAGAMAWSEAGATYARNIRGDKWKSMHAGATVKILIGYDAASVSNRSSTEVFRGNDEVILGPADVDIAWASSYSSEDGYRFTRNGMGVAADIGFTWTGNTSDASRPYRWKVGVSLLDAGRVWYRRNADSYTYSSTDSSVFTGSQFNDVRDPDDLIGAINQSGNTAQAELTSDRLAMWAPMAASIQFDAPVRGPLYISGTAVIGMRFPVGANAVERNDLLAVVPRVEFRWFEIGLPVSLYKWTELSMGTYLRMGPLTIGSENLNSWLIPGRYEGSDIYLALKINSDMFNRKNASGPGQGCPALY